MTNIYQPLHKMNHDFFSEPNEINSYWAGFIAADGHIDKDSNRISIKLHAKDSGHVLMLQEDIEFTGSAVLSLTQSEVRLRFSSQQMKLDLSEKYNIGPRKTLTLEPPTNLSNKNMRLAYIAGYIDGDGSYCWQGRANHKRPTLAIYGTQAMLEWIRFELGDIDNAIGYAPRDNLYSLSYTGNKALYAYSLFSDMALPFLERKRNYWDKTKSEINNMDYFYRKGSFNPDDK